MISGATAEVGPLWLRDFFPGYFAMVMGTGIVAVAARLLGRDAFAWPLFAISLAAYPLLWAILLARIARFPRVVLADFASHERGPSFLTIVAANGVLGSQFAVFNTLSFLLPALFWFSLVLWTLLVYGFLSTVTVCLAKPDLEHGLNGAWLLLVVATESIAVLACFLALRIGAPPPLVFAALAFYLLGAMLYMSLSALIFFRWVFRPMHPAEMGAPWWINMGAVAIATLAGARLMALPGNDPNLLLVQRFVTPFTVLLWATSTFWIPLLAILFVWKELQRGPHGYDPSLWSVVFPLGMYVAATHDYATEAHLHFLYAISHAVFWIALLAWVLTFVGMECGYCARTPSCRSAGGITTRGPCEIQRQRGRPCRKRSWSCCDIPRRHMRCLMPPSGWRRAWAAPASMHSRSARRSRSRRRARQRWRPAPKRSSQPAKTSGGVSWLWEPRSAAGRWAPAKWPPMPTGSKRKAGRRRSSPNGVGGPTSSSRGGRGRRTGWGARHSGLRSSARTGRS
jgi:tellurite resistance protein TehA-like permease